MCGISGILNFDDREVSESEIKKMTKALDHRGPDDNGFFVDKKIGLGHNRLSIIDLSANGHQPMCDRQAQYQIVFNGEIYNFRELRNDLKKDGIQFKSQTDTEVLLYLFIKYGADCLRRLNGMFAFAIWNSKNKELFIARDRLGKKPLKYYSDDHRFVFASELKAILTLESIKKEPDWDAINEYLAFKYVPCPRTGFIGIKKLPPAHYLIIKANGEQVIKKYWDLDFKSNEEFSEDQWLKTINEKLVAAVNRRLVSDVPLGAHLSGGIDSSLVTAITANELGKTIKTFSIGFKEEKYNELPFAKIVSQRCKTEHHEFIMEPGDIDILPKLAYYYEEPFADASAMPTWRLSEITKRQITVALNGDGGDESFAGYERYAAMKLIRAMKFLPGKKISAVFFNYLYGATRREIFHKSSRLLKAHAHSDIKSFANIIRYFDDSELKTIFAENSTFIGSDKIMDHLEKAIRPKTGNWLNNLLNLGIKTHLPDQLLTKVDIASMAHGLEIRSPFLDYELMEHAAAIPANLKLKGFTKKYLLKKLAEKYLPAECIYRPKKGFSVPLNFWFKDQIGDYIKSNLLNAKFIEHGFSKQAINNLIAEHQSGKINRENELYSLLMLKLWFDAWF